MVCDIGDCESLTTETTETTEDTEKIMLKEKETKKSFKMNSRIN